MEFRPASAVFTIGVVNAQFSQDPDLQRFHFRRVGGILMIITQKMEESVNYQVTAMVFESLALFDGFARDRLVGQCDIAKKMGGLGWLRTGEGQDIGWPILSAEITVQFLHPRVAAEQEAYFRAFGRRGVRFLQRSVETLGHDHFKIGKFLPTWILDRDFDGQGLGDQSLSMLDRAGDASRTRREAAS
jgi:hypothetical protein